MDESWLSVDVGAGLMRAVGGILANADTSNVLSLVALVVLLGTAGFAWRTVRLSRDAAAKLGGILRDMETISGRVERVASHLDSAARALSDITRRVDEVSSRLQATVEAVERSRLEDRLLRQLERYERINTGVQTIMLASETTADLGEQVVLIRTAQAPMRAALAAIPGADGSHNGSLPKCWRLAQAGVWRLPDRLTGQEVVHIQGGEIGGAAAEIEAVLRKVHKELGVLQSAELVDALAPLKDEASAVVYSAESDGQPGV